MSVKRADAMGCRGRCSIAGGSGWSSTGLMACIRSGSQARRGRPPAVPVQTERRVIAVALAWPTCGPQWYSDQLARDGVSIAPVTIWRLLRRQQLGTRRARLAVLEQCSAVTTGLLTERTAKPKPARHVEAAEPGDAALAGHLLCRQAERRGQGVADHGL